VSCPAFDLTRSSEMYLETRSNLRNFLPGVGILGCRSGLVVVLDLPAA
jgi:hypothetical protein